MPQHPRTTPSRSSAAVLAVLASSAAAIASGPELEPGDTVVSQYVVQLAPGRTIDELIDVHDEFVRAAYPSRNLYLVETFPGEEIHFEHELETNNAVAGHESNQVNGVTGGHTQNFFVGIVPTGGYENQPAAKRIGLPFARTVSTGAGVVVAILDTGVADHPQLAGKVLNGYNFVDDNADTSEPGDGIDDNSNGIVDEMRGHGTFVAGLVHMIAPDALILPVKVLTDDGNGSTYSLAAGIYYAIDRGANVINMSLSTPAQALAARDAVNEAISRGIVVVAAVANDSLPSLSYPAATPGAIGVAATDTIDRLARFSNYGSDVSLCAPGTGVISLTADGDYAVAGGTSYAAPQVAGVAALVKARMPLLSAPAVRSLIMANCDFIAAKNGRFGGVIGAGRLSAGRVMKATLPPNPTPFMHVPAP